MLRSIVAARSAVALARVAMTSSANTTWVNGRKVTPMAQPAPAAAIDMIAKAPIVEVEGHAAKCDGGAGALGHPRVYINLDKEGPKACGYCGKRFASKGGAHHH
eukprot:a508352_6610.p1 GENE.a508352_6610~~a508352_6610.p1  ORF type:complete len:112 (+),score=24.22 a508352_6610:26-337(+)